MFAIQRHDNYYYRKHFVLLVIKWIEGQANQPPRSTLTIAGECSTQILIWTLTGQKEVSILERCPYFRG